MIKTMKTKSALSYFGSDSEVAGELAAMLDHCKHVTIPFVGGAAILPHLNARAIVCNDLNLYAINFYRVASGVDGDQLELFQRCEKTLSHPHELEKAQHVIDETTYPYGSDETELAWAYWALCWIGRKGKGGTRHMGGLPSVRRTANGGTNASRIRAAADDLKDWAQHFERCEWESMDFRKLLPKVADMKGCGVYCDPPWVGAGRDYLHTFSAEDHSELEFLLRRFAAATVVVRYGDCATIRDLYSAPCWRIIDASSRTQTNEVRGEIWITNKASDVLASAKEDGNERQG